MLDNSMLNPKPDLAASEVPLERAAIHAAMIESIDKSLADAMAALEKAGKKDNTLILVLSDNGASHQLAYNRKLPEGVRPGSMNTFLNHGAALAALSNTPLRNYKTSFYEGGIASPLIAWWPNGLKGKGRISHRLTHIADIMPTCLELADAGYPSEFEGRDLIPLAGESFVSEFHHSEEESDSPRLIAWPKAVRHGNWKLVLQNAARPALFDISKDRNERNNLAAEMPDRVQKLKQLHGTVYPRRLSKAP